MIAASEAVRRTPPSSTAALLAALAPLERLGLSPEQAAIIGMGQFPVGGPASYSDDFLELRPGGHLHEGIDIVASTGTPLRAPVNGILRYDTSDPTGYGLAAIVTAPDGTFYLMAHMSATVKGLASGSKVHVGQVVGFVGATGDATGPHCHFEIHPHGGAAVDGKPTLDAWQARAIAAVPALVAFLEHKPAPGTPAAIPRSAVPLPVPVPATLAGPALPPALTLAAPTFPLTGGQPILAAQPDPSQVTGVAASVVAMLVALVAMTVWWPAGARVPVPAGEAPAGEAPEPAPEPVDRAPAGEAPEPAPEPVDQAPAGGAPAAGAEDADLVAQDQVPPPTRHRRRGRRGRASRAREAPQEV